MAHRMVRVLLRQLFFFTVTTCSVLGINQSIASSAESTNFLVLSDIHLQYDTHRAMQINPSKANRKNDLDRKTFYSLLNTLKHSVDHGVVKKPGFILIQGDLVGHKRLSHFSVQDSITDVLTHISQTFPNTPMMYVYGNNDSIRADYGPFYYKKATTVAKSPYDIITRNVGWKNGFLSTGNRCTPSSAAYPCLTSENTKTGYFAARIAPHFKLIGLNTVSFSHRHMPILDGEAESQLVFLEKELKLAASEHDAVLLAMHIPPGNNVYNHSAFWIPARLNTFLRLVNTYHHTVVGILAGHTHMDEVKVIKGPHKSMLSGVYVAPALSTSHGNAPAVRTYYYDSKDSKRGLIDYDTFSFSDQNGHVSLRHVYNFQQHYCGQRVNRASDCLNRATPDKVSKYFTAGNPRFAGKIDAPEDILVQLEPLRFFDLKRPLVSGLLVH